MTHICIVEDDDSIRQLLKLTLENFQYEITDFDNGEDAYQYLLDNKVDLAILDLMLPRMNGYDILKQIRQNKLNRETPVIILSAKDQEVDKILGLDLGADDYMTKPFSVLELAARIRTLLRRTHKETNKLDLGILHIDVDQRIVHVEDKVVELTYKEFELLRYLATNSGRAISREELLNQVWGYDFVGETRTLDVHINSLRKKLGPTGRNYIKSVRQLGYRLSVGDQDA
ncbi:two-component system alkaline phosphatase synthesis response regulator PhoP [Faecalicoccus acidiformans]|uniref:Response regulator transcription factor n=1 Tax=Faecalicoccus acidiformans TaxID=915173 RepID=A0A7W8FYQ9_9FIRM|nr:response regulator transcription factor [Faecalicoccus acidiformans]MBB5184222.1 two-component system alkaline phosphatase synthesis response regulator PhoP [Faecalicoccus acidiformans]MBM6831425.1 response regulator transcription factor [Faecalicoccus acidiformans]MDM8203104.1 response regulator transcription factor [Faecalicoccus acidiformans]HIW17696.1 response regulator transcription factor [Candidatus Faecalicoccus intestinipullorum]